MIGLRAAFLALLALAATNSAAVLADETEGAVYDPDADATALVDAALAGASAREPALIVFGANWCHDSRGFAERVTGDSPLGAFMAEHYDITFVDIGLRNLNLDQPARFGVNAIHGTPTLVITYGRGLAENISTVHDWRAVYDAGDADLAAYFARYAGAAPAVEADASADLYAAAQAWPPYQRAMEGLDALPIEDRVLARDYYWGIARSLARNAMGRVGDARGLAIAADEDLAALGLPLGDDLTEAVMDRMAAMDIDLEARRRRDLADTADAALEADED